MVTRLSFKVTKLSNEYISQHSYGFFISPDHSMRQEVGAAAGNVTVETNEPGEDIVGEGGHI